MKVTVVGASGLIGTKVVELLKADGHDVVASSRSSGVDVLTGDGLADALADADALVDVTNSPGSAQEKIITESGIPYSIVRATQFAEFTDAITESMTNGDEVRVPDALIQPIPAEQVAVAVARAAKPARRSTAS